MTEHQPVAAALWTRPRAAETRTDTTRRKVGTGAVRWDESRPGTPSH